VIQGKETERFGISYGVPQGSTLSPILFLLYVSELLELCNRLKERISVVGFSDDIHILSYRTSTESNYRNLERVHEKCIEWVRRYGIKFAPQKYELTHFIRARTKFNLAATLNFQGIEKQPSLEVKVLGVWLDTRLR
jgi:hypothetical protein